MYISDLLQNKTALISEILPIADYIDSDNCFVLSDGSFCDILQITTKDLTSTMSDDVERDIAVLDRFFKTYSGDIKIIAINFPTDTKAQQEYLKHKLAEEQNEIFRGFLTAKLEKLIWAQKERTEREFYLLIFAADMEKLYENRTAALNYLSSAGLLHSLPKKKKLQIIFKLNNKSTSITV